MTAAMTDSHSVPTPGGVHAARAGLDRMIAVRRPAERDLTEIDSLLDLSSGLWMWLAGANVIMQLANPAVGYGVLESRVERGRADTHPVKRIHDEVFSTSSSPVRYSGNSRELQLWVALCLIRFFVDQYELLYRELDAAEREHVLTLASPLATVLNVPEEDWPATWAEYEDRFAAGMADAEIDDPVRQMLDDLCAFRILDGKFRGAGDLARRALGPTNHSYTRFGVPAVTREQMNWEITPADLRRKRRMNAVARVADKVLPMPLKKMYTLALWDMRIRRRLGISVF